MSNLFAAAMPILPGKKEQWKKFSNELKTTRNREFSESRKKLGVQERTFLQSTPQNDLVIVTLEGKDPQKAFQKLSEGTDEFTKWFNAQVKEIHGVDMTQKTALTLPELVVETESLLQYA